MVERNGPGDAEVDAEIQFIRDELGDRLFIPAHHYQRDEIVRFADCTGDSLELSRISAGTPADLIVFCGVHFMAEMAAALAPDGKMVFTPDPSAGCPLADFARVGEVRVVWDTLQDIHPGEYVPVTYANSGLEVKAFCGQNGGLVCTSSNAGRIFSRVLDSGKRVFFMPDRNLGLNTASSLGLAESCSVVDAHGGERAAGRVHAGSNLEDSRIVVWNGWCAVHRRFTRDQVNRWRRKDDGYRIIVHPECDPEVVEASDDSGSTAKIKSVVEKASAGSGWVIGTELNMVQRLAAANRDKRVQPLAASVCEEMSKNRRRSLLSVLRSLRSGDFTNQLVLPADVKENARAAISRMLELS